VNPLLIAALALAGWLAGWPQRAVIVRYAVPSGEPSRANCPACGHQAGPASSRSHQAGPASGPTRPSHPPGLWRLSRFSAFPGRCPACRARTGPSALAVAVTTAILLGALAARVHPGLVLAAACWLAVCAVPLAFVDAAVRRLPDRLNVPAYAGAAVFLLLAAATGGHWPLLLRALLGGFALAGFYLALFLISPSAMGPGDVKLAASLGTVLAWFGWPTLIAGGFAGFLMAGLYGTALLASGRATRKQQIPFGPFMIAGAFLAILLWPAVGS
jgi:leader peptidase (prepilin peptidase)/N-methyltransferase